MAPSIGPERTEAKLAERRPRQWHEETTTAVPASADKMGLVVMNGASGSAVNHVRKSQHSLAPFRNSCPSGSRASERLALALAIRSPSAEAQGKPVPWLPVHVGIFAKCLFGQLAGHDGSLEEETSQTGHCPRKTEQDRWTGHRETAGKYNYIQNGKPMPRRYLMLFVTVHWMFAIQGDWRRHAAKRSCAKCTPCA